APRVGGAPREDRLHPPRDADRPPPRGLERARQPQLDRSISTQPPEGIRLEDELPHDRRTPSPLRLPAELAGVHRGQPGTVRHPAPRPRGARHAAPCAPPRPPQAQRPDQSAPRPGPPPTYRQDPRSEDVTHAQL